MAARASLTVYDAAALGTLTVWTAGVVADGHKFVNDGKTVLLAKNADAVPTQHTITIETPAVAEGLAVAEDAVVLANTVGLIKVIGPFARDVFNQADGCVYVDYEGAHEVDIEVCVVRVNPELH